MKTFIACLILAGSVLTTSMVHAEDILGALEKEAASQINGFGGFSATRGKAFFEANHNTGKPETPSCTSCHSTDPTANGQTRAGKVIAPMASSKNPERYSDPAKVEKWFRRNCNSVLGRACSLQEKGDFIAFMKSL